MAASWDQQPVANRSSSVKSGNRNHSTVQADTFSQSWPAFTTNSTSLGRPFESRNISDKFDNQDSNVTSNESHDVTWTGINPAKGHASTSVPSNSTPDWPWDWTAGNNADKVSDRFAYETSSSGFTWGLNSSPGRPPSSPSNPTFPFDLWNITNNSVAHLSSTPSAPTHTTETSLTTDSSALRPSQSSGTTGSSSSSSSFPNSTPLDPFGWLFDPSDFNASEFSNSYYNSTGAYFNSAHGFFNNSSLASMPDLGMTSAEDALGAESDSVSFNNLSAAIIQCFVIILLGYVAGRAGLVSRVQGDGIASFISKFCLPSLLFVSMCELNFGSVNWMFLLGVFISKSAIFVLVAMVTLIAKRPVNLGYAGLFAIFATQSNDFALGYPIVQALYAESNPGFLKYIYLFAPISLAVLNPIGFIMLEIHKHRSVAHDQETKTWLQVMGHVGRGMITNPIIFMTVIGIVGNFVFEQTVPAILRDILKVLGQAYSAGALFYLGLSMVGKIRAQLGIGLIIPILLIAAKSILLPLLCWEVIDTLVPGENDTSYSMYGFLYGTIPTAPSLVLFATQFDVAQDIVATGLVLGTFISAPLMFVSAKMMTVMVGMQQDFHNLLHETAFDISIISLISGLWVVVIFLISGKWHRVPHRFTLALTCSNLLACLGMILYKACGEDSLKGWRFYIIIVLLLVGIFSARCWTAILAVVLCLLRVRSLCYVLQIQVWLYFLGFGLPTVLTGLIFLIGSHNIDNEIGPAFHYGNLQTVMSLILLTCSLLVSIVSIVYWQRAERHMSHFTVLTRYASVSSEGPGSPNLTTRDPDQGAVSNTIVANGNSSLAASPPRNTSSNSHGPGSRARRATSIEDLVDSESTLQMEREENNSLMENISERTCLLGQCSAEQRHACMDNLRSYAATVVVNDASPHEEELKTVQQQQQEEYQTGHHLILLLMLMLSIFVGLFLCAWKMFHKNVSGIYVEIEFLDVVLNYGQGFLLLAVFGFDTRLVFSPIMRRRMSRFRMLYVAYVRLRRLIYGADMVHLPNVSELDEETTQTCQQFVDYHKENCTREIVRDRRFRFKTFKDVFTGASMCNWLLRAGLVSNRNDGVEYGQHLLLGRVISHINSEFHFHDSPHFYKFMDNYEQLSC